MSEAEDKAAAIERYKLSAYTSMSAKKLIRAMCMECMGGYVAEISRCSSTLCPLRFFRHSAESLRKGFQDSLTWLEETRGVDSPEAKKLRRKLARRSDGGIPPIDDMDHEDDDNEEDQE
jgi:hypothetical protein